MQGNEGLNYRDDKGNGKERPEATADTRGCGIQLDRMRQLIESGKWMDDSKTSAGKCLTIFRKKSISFISHHTPKQRQTDYRAGEIIKELDVNCFQGGII